MIYFIFDDDLNIISWFTGGIFSSLYCKIYFSLLAKFDTSRNYYMNCALVDDILRHWEFPYD